MPSTLDDAAPRANNGAAEVNFRQVQYGVDRRRPGRVEYDNPALIALLRQRQDGSEAFDNLREVPYRPSAFSPWPMIWMTVLSSGFWVAAAYVLGLLR